MGLGNGSEGDRGLVMLVVKSGPNRNPGSCRGCVGGGGGGLVRFGLILCYGNFFLQSLSVLVFVC